MLMRSTNVLRVMLIVLLGVTLSGCEVVGGIFKAGIWVGAIGVILIVFLVAFAAMKMRR